MRNRLSIAAVWAAAMVLPSGLAGADFPRTPDGRPDLSGMYDIATLTPLTRPAALGDRMSLTDAEAKALAESTAATMAKNNQASDPNRAAPPLGGDGSTGPSGNVGGYNTLWVDIGSGAFKIDGQWRTSIIIDPPDGRMPPMTPAASKLAAARIRLNRANRGDAWWVAEGITPGPYDDPELRPTAERCLLGFGTSAGPPALPVMYNNLKQIVQTKDHVMILNEMVHDVRIVRLNSKHEPPEIRRWMGDSIGHWEGDTLVVDTTNFNDRPALAGATRNLHVVERFTPIDAKTLRYKFTVEDPTVWTKPWTGEMVWPATADRIYEYACHEGNYSFEGILRGARRLEAEAAAGKAPAK
jgi:hypothetical protein